MTWQNVLALAVFIGVCGFIAYWGDVLGRRMGKRRLSLFGLRPRYTAIVTTTITGMLIAGFTIAVMSIVSQDVQQLVLRGHRILVEYREVRLAFREAKENLRLQKDIAEEARDQAERAVGQREQLAADIERITKNLKRLGVDLRRNKLALSQTKKELAGANNNLASAIAEVVRRKEEIVTLKGQIAELERRRNQLQEIVTAWETEYAGLREGKVIFRPFQEIARRTIKSTKPRSEIRADLIALLSKASDTARDEGARIGKNGRAVQIISKRFGEGPFYDESDIIGAIVDVIAEGSGEVVARIYSRSNLFEGEQANVDCELNPNRLVYMPGEEVASAVIDGSASRGQILGNLINFLRSEVRYAATHKGIIPVYDEEGQPSVGQIEDWDEIFDLVDRIRFAGRPVPVRALAAKETWSADRLDLNLTVGDSR